MLKIVKNKDAKLEGSTKSIYDKLKEKKSTDEIIAEMKGLSPVTVKNIIYTLIANGYVQEEETKDYEIREAQKTIVLEELRNGIPVSEIAKHLHTNCSTLNKFLNEIDQGRTTQEEIDTLKYEIESKKIDSNPNYQRILEGLRRGEHPYEMEKHTTVVEGTIRTMIRKLVQFGKISQDEVDRSRLQRDIKDMLEHRTKINGYIIQNYIIYCKNKLISNELTQDECDLLTETLQFSSKFITPQNMRVAIEGLVKSGNLSRAKEFYESCMDKISNDQELSGEISKFGETLNDYEKKLEEAKNHQEKSKNDQDENIEER